MLHGPPGMCNQVETKKERSDLTSIHQNFKHYIQGGGGGGRLRTMSLRISCSKSKSITFYGFPGLLNQVETQKEQSQLTSLHQISKHYLRSGGSENNDFKNKLPQIQILSRSRGPLG